MPSLAAEPNFSFRRGRYEFAKSIAAADPTGPLRGGRDSSLLSSLDIDAVLGKFSHLNAFPAEFSRILKLRPDACLSMFEAFKSFPVIIPFHCEYHWIAVVLTENSVIVANSAPSSAHEAHIKSLFETVSRWYKADLGYVPKLVTFRCATQPIGSTECGVHLIMNAIALCGDELKACEGTLDLDSIRPLVRRIADGSAHPSSLLRKCRVAAASQMVPCFTPLSHGQIQSWLDGAGYKPHARLIGIGAETMFPERIGKRHPSCWFSHYGLPAFTKAVITALGHPSLFIHPRTHLRAARGLKGGSAPLSESDIVNILNGAKEGDIVAVEWSHVEDDSSERFRWVGILGRGRAKGRWSIGYDIPDEIVHGVIPNPCARYYSVVVNPPGEPRPDEACLPPRPRDTAPVDAESSDDDDDDDDDDDAATLVNVNATGNGTVRPQAAQARPTTTPLAFDPAAFGPAAIDDDDEDEAFMVRLQLGAVPAAVAPTLPAPAATPAPSTGPAAAGNVSRPAAAPAPAGSSAPAVNTHYGTGCPEIDTIYADLHLAKNAPLPQKLRKVSGEEMSATQLLAICGKPEAATHPMHRFHLAPSTVKSHKRVLRWLKTNLPESHTSIDVAIPAAVAQIAKDKHWAPSSWLTHLNNIHGALSALFLYRGDQVHVSMTGCPNWRASIRTVQHLKPLVKPNQPKAAKEEQIFEAMRLEPRPEVRAAIEVGWLLAARGGDVRQLLATDFKICEESGGTPATMAVTFRRGKTAKKDQYTVGAPLPSAETLAFIMEQQEAKSWAFPGLVGKDLMLALRRADQRLEQRSLRRGRLQHLAARGWSDAQLMELSRHATIQMLRRYLDMGVVSATTRETAVRAAMAPASS